MQAHLTTDSESLLSPTLPTPRAQEPGSTSPGYGDSLNDFANRVTNGYAAKDLFRTPAASEAERGHQPESKSRGRGGQVTLSGQMMELFPTPNTMDMLPARTPEQKEANKGKGGYANVRETVVNDLPATNWGKFEPAIERWEQVLGRKAPAPTNPDGKDGSHRLSSAFTEWMMGVPEGWITGCGLTRAEELKACGNGVVPQQAELALKILIQGVQL